MKSVLLNSRLKKKNKDYGDFTKEIKLADFVKKLKKKNLLKEKSM